MYICVIGSMRTSSFTMPIARFVYSNDVEWIALLAVDGAEVQGAVYTPQVFSHVDLTTIDFSKLPPFACYGLSSPQFMVYYYGLCVIGNAQRKL